ncbi:MAG: carboxyl-terminal protease, partial [Bdellovibrio sp.]
GFYYLPSGRSPQMKGLEPDVIVHFDRLTPSREADQFMYPLASQEAFAQIAGKSFSDQDCLETSEVTDVEDVQLNKARQILFCSKAVVRAGL